MSVRLCQQVPWYEGLESVSAQKTIGTSLVAWKSLQLASLKTKTYLEGSQTTTILLICMFSMFQTPRALLNVVRHLSRSFRQKGSGFNTHALIAFCVTSIACSVEQTWKYIILGAKTRGNLGYDLAYPVMYVQLFHQKKKQEESTRLREYSLIQDNGNKQDCRKLT